MNSGAVPFLLLYAVGEAHAILVDPGRTFLLYKWQALVERRDPRNFQLACYRIRDPKPTLVPRYIPRILYGRGWFLLKWCPGIRPRMFVRSRVCNDAGTLVVSLA